MEISAAKTFKKFKINNEFSKESVFSGEIPKDGVVHFIAIGGIGMSALAKILVESGYKVSGSDLKGNSITDSLVKTGVAINIGHKKDNIASNCLLVVVSTAIKEDNPELVEAKNRNLTIIHRAQMLEFLMNGTGGNRKPFSIGITGTHGKTTTSGMTAFVFEEAGENPSFALGGQLPHYDINSKQGTGNSFISELDESDGSIELYAPQISVITNIELDHADHFSGGLEEIFHTFERYIKDLHRDSKIIINIDDSGNLELLRRIHPFFAKENIIFYSSNPSNMLYKDAEYRAKSISTAPDAKFELYGKNELLGEITLGVPGEHNISNALAACAVCFQSGIPFSSIEKALRKFTGMKRRFQTLGYYHGARIIDDYAHHPTEIKATLKTAREVVSCAGKGRVIAVFQPHRFTRLKSLWEDFSASFYDADFVLLCDVYPAGESQIEGIDSENLLRAMKNKNITNENFRLATGDLLSVAEVLKEEVREGDIVLTIGAGSITSLGGMILDK